MRTGASEAAHAEVVARRTAVSQCRAFVAQPTEENAELAQQALHNLVLARRKADRAAGRRVHNG